MTTNAIAYLKLQEDMRHQREIEKETARANRANESLKSSELGEKTRHNVVQEGLDHNKNIASLIHTKSVADTADKDRFSREKLSALDRTSREDVAREDRLSREKISSADRQSKETIAALDRQQDDVNSQRSSYATIYSADQRYKGIIDSATISAREKAADREFLSTKYYYDNFGVPGPEHLGYGMTASGFINQPGTNMPDLRRTKQFWSSGNNLPLNYQMGVHTMETQSAGLLIDGYKAAMQTNPFKGLR